MPVVNNILGVDFGAKRVGIALSTTGQSPKRLETLPNDERLLPALQTRITTHVVDTVVVGLPRNLEGEDTPQTARAREFAGRLQAAQPDLRVVLQDEALTTQVARERLQRQKVADIAAVLDQEAAAIIVEDFLGG